MFTDFLAKAAEFLNKTNLRVIELVLFGTWLVAGYVFVLPDYGIVGWDALPYALGISLLPVVLFKMVVAFFIVLFEIALRFTPFAASLEMPVEKVRARLIRGFVDRGITYRTLEEWSLGPLGKALARIFRGLVNPANTYFCREPFVVVRLRDITTPRGPETFVALDYESTPKAMTLARYLWGIIKYR